MRGEMGGVKTVAIILNGISLKKDYFYIKILPALQHVAKVHVHETRTRHDAISLASKAVEKRYDVIYAAGGDGTLNQVVNGMLAGNENTYKLPVLGLIPLGSGNDYARTVNIKSDAGHIIGLLMGFAAKPVDVGRITFTGEPDKPVCYFINIADVGMGPQVVKRLLDSGRVFGTTLTYYTAILQTFATYRLQTITVKTPQWSWQGKARVVAVGNGRFFGSGIGITPEAIPDDGLFNCCIGGRVSAFDFLKLQGKMRSGRRVVHPLVHYNQAQLVELTSDKPCMIEADGELAGNLPVTIEMLPGRLNFLW
ncbi:MAG: diacylglycerol kinase family lipid kinase [Flammeovirgaceae bacterium]|nr:MAG: diacylglycerol kinase family lipid kinase [Flammeovirgaceae bacterium]